MVPNRPGAQDFSHSRKAWGIACAAKRRPKMFGNNFTRRSSPFQKTMRLVLQALSFNGSPLISPTRLQRLQRDVATCVRTRRCALGQARRQQDVDWINRVLQNGILAAELEGQYYEPTQSKELIVRLYQDSLVRTHGPNREGRWT
jgi:hypothetical protein